MVVNMIEKYPWRHWRKPALIMALIVMLVYLVLPPFIAARHGRGVYTDVKAVPAANVAIVFGAGLKNQNTAPSDVLDDRLNVAAALYRAGKVKRLLVSGDNRVASYSEPDVMKQTLITKYGVPPEAIHADYAGRRTYDTCIRARNLWGVQHAILVSQAFHLPRALWTCRALGIESVGVSASLHQYETGVLFEAREALAWYNAFIDLYLWHPSHVRGAFVEDLEKKP
jgi:vancomycin permeability regulator SanA